MTFADALSGKEIPLEIRHKLILLDISFYSFEGAHEIGQLVVHLECAQDLEQIFAELYERMFPIKRVIPVSKYGWDDNASMADNNTSAFNYRFIALTDRLSNHAYGRAIDINPMQNPYIQRDGKIVPQGARYDPKARGTITEEIAELFIRRGWEWGGNWSEDRKDWQHFEKP